MASTAPSPDSDLASISTFIQLIPSAAHYAIQTTRYLFFFSGWLIQSLRNTLSTLLYPSLIILSPITLVLSALLYILAPATVLAQVILDILVFTPYHFAVYLVDSIYPIYVFCGAACIIGVIIGYVARWIVLWVAEMVKLDINGAEKDEKPRKMLGQAGKVKLESAED
ncbi:hypothetical protein BDP27DRAFT_1455610 [Rhodocollybia butyracea]|uniref:Uncharacterized protein n=1 Tax=Rhodocollybia butyracea TaxID=206335 RepID=A0A9P5P2E8_9AGAR|nr:hypothetical protein BDP27DRAFT_1455610 [Rhodocollybia butyracea]